jgi:phospholipase/lecithinase/hemolysin
VGYNALLLLTYNLAYGGATIDSALVAPFQPTVSSVAEQIENEWFPSYASKPAAAPWSSDDTLFAIFDGINDVQNSWNIDLPATTTLNNNVFAVYRGLVDELYYAGARNFLFVNVPPVDRAPLNTVNSAEDQAAVKADILAWNTLLAAMVQDLKKTYPDVNVFTVDANLLFTQVLDNPASNPLSAGYLNTTSYCDAYQK